MKEVLQFIGVFSSPSNSILFTEKACYWFATILHHRFKNSTIVYNPDIVHFATKIDGRVYDITGLVEYAEDYIDWNHYKSYSEDAPLIEKCCIRLEGGDGG